MKRTILTLLIIALVIIGLGWLIPRLIPYSAEKVLILTAILIGTGLTISNFAASFLFKLFHLDRSNLTRPNRWAVSLGIVFTGVCIAMVLNDFAIQPLSSIFFGRVSRRVFMRINDFIGFSFVVLLVLTIFYVLLRLYEETIAKRAKRFSRQSFLQGGWKLVLKLVVGGVIVFVLTLSIASSDWVKAAGYAFEQTRYGWGEQRNDSIGIVFVYSEGKSHDWYFDVAYQLCSGLRQIGTKAILVPLPPRLPLGESNVKSLERISKAGPVVFAVPSEEAEGGFVRKQEYPDLWVRHPVNNLVEFDWGVVSAQNLPQWSYRYHRYYPLAYREVGRGYPVPDAAVRAVQKFLGKAKEATTDTDRKKFQVGDFQTGLYADQSASIFNNLNPLANLRITASINENEKTLEWYEWGAGRKLTRDALLNLRGRIIVVDPGESIASFSQFGPTYAQIIHQILRRTSVIPLDRWTPSFIALVILFALGFFWAFNAWIASLALISFTFVWGSLIQWISGEYGLIVEWIPLVIGTWFSIVMFVFVRVNHERSFLHVVEKQRALQELQTAHDMQLGLMPTADPIVPGFDVSGLSKPADEVGGDFFDYIWLDPARTRLGIVVADVSGKAMKAAMTAVLTSGMLYRELGSKDTPKSVLGKINKPLHLKTDKRVFTAMLFALINRKTKTLSYSNAGQMMPLLKRNGQLRYLKTSGPRLPLGTQENTAYEETSMKLQRGDIVVFSSDGIPEAMNDKQELYGFERFESMIRDLPTGISAQQLSQKIIEVVSGFIMDAPQHDDMTVVVVKVD